MNIGVLGGTPQRQRVGMNIGVLGGTPHIEGRYGCAGRDRVCTVEG